MHIQKELQFGMGQAELPMLMSSAAVAIVLTCGTQIHTQGSQLAFTFHADFYRQVF